MKKPIYPKDPTTWGSITQNLIKNHPLKPELIISIVLESWDDLFKSNIGGLVIGKDIYPSPQSIGYLLETLVAHKLSQIDSSTWKRTTSKDEKDIVCLTDNDLSIEIKCSSSPGSIYGNRSYAQPPTENDTKTKDSFYLAINFDDISKPDEFPNPKINLIRFGFLEHIDWVPQKSEKGNQARLKPESNKYKFVTIYKVNK